MSSALLHRALTRATVHTNHLATAALSTNATAAPASQAALSKPIVRSTSTGKLAVPANTFHEEPSDPYERESALRARQLLPFNYGRHLDVQGEQFLSAVGHPSLKQRQAAGKPIPALFHELTVRGKRFAKNRIVVSPMCQYSSADGFLNDWHLVHLGQYAIGGAGLVIVEATAVAFEGRISPTDSGLWKDEQTAPLKRITQFLASQDCRAGIQLAHAGRKASTIPPFHLPRNQPAAEAVTKELGGWEDRVIAPSAEAFAGDYWTPIEMTRDDIERLREQFVASAKRAVEAGFEYIEIHGAHGYLLTQFLSSTSNKRTDSYGGSFSNRTRLLREIVSDVKAVLPESVVLGVRLSCEEYVPDGWHIEDTIELVRQLEPLGVDLIDCSSGGNSVTQKIAVKPGYQVDFAHAVKKVFPNLLVAAVGLITEPQQANTIIQEGSADVVMIAREFLRNPHWPLEAARKLDYDIEWAPQYQRAKPTTQMVAGTRS
jgi:2,4-dienoyl-CoA reductase-like NADH-dependent reductase (Old Yellow Enzyme family)